MSYVDEDAEVARLYELALDHGSSVARIHQALWEAMTEQETHRLPVSLLLVLAPDAVNDGGHGCWVSERPPLALADLNRIDEWIAESRPAIAALLPVGVALDDADELVQCVGAGNPAATLTQIDRALTSPHATVRAHAAANPAASPDQIQRAAIEKHRLIREAALLNPGRARVSRPRGT